MTRDKKKDMAGVPAELPRAKMHIVLADKVHLLGFDFPDAPGIPRIRESLARRFRAARDSACLNEAMPADEWSSSLATIGYELDRADYHLARFWSTLELLKKRRELVGGPVVGDAGPARAIYCESAGYLSAIRTVVDLIVYVAARRAGLSAEDAENRWKPYRIVTGQIPAQRDDLKVLQLHRDWFETLNAYRNAMMHRGWKDAVPGYFGQADTAPEADHPFNNIMLMPDIAPIKKNARPHAWTYSDRTWLDDTIRNISSEATEVVSQILDVWAVPLAKPGKVPLAEQPTVFLYVPYVPVLNMVDPPAMPVFLSKKAAREYLKFLAGIGFGVSSNRLRAVRIMRIPEEGAGFLLAFNRAMAGDRVVFQIFDTHNGALNLAHSRLVSTSDQLSSYADTIWFRVPDFVGDAIYVFV